jgi:hypothetical protein
MAFLFAAIAWTVLIIASTLLAVRFRRAGLSACGLPPVA